MQQLTFEEGAIESIGYHLLSRGISKVFIISGKHLYDNGMQKSVLSAVSSASTYFYLKDGPNVDNSEVQHAYQLYLKQGTPAMLAIGGGSVMDLAKAILFQHYHAGFSEKIVFIAAPTTAGSGSEATSIAVIYENKIKRSLENPNLLPDVVILDPKLTYSLSPKQTAITGADALSQAIESIWSRKATTESVGYAMESLRITLDNLKFTVHHPSPETRKNMLLSAHLAGRAINISRTTGPHALSYYLTAHHNVPHGQAVALFLPLFFVYNDEKIAAKNDSTFINRVNELYRLIGINNSDEGQKFFRAFINDLKLATTLKDLGIQRDLILDDLMKEVNIQRFGNNPVEFNRENLMMLCKQYL